MNLAKFFISALAVTGEYDQLFQGWSEIGKGIVGSALKYLIIPVGMAVIGVFLILEIIKCIELRRKGQGEDVGQHILTIVLLIVLIAILASYYAWGPMVGLG